MSIDEPDHICCACLYMEGVLGRKDADYRLNCYKPCAAHKAADHYPLAHDHPDLGASWIVGELDARTPQPLSSLLGELLGP